MVRVRNGQRNRRKTTAGNFLRRWGVFVSLSCILLLNGCLYPDEMRKQNNVNLQEYLPVVQQAVDVYREKTGVLPIKNSEIETPLYEKYVIDFQKLKERGLMSTLPPNAFESGGTYIYVLIHVEEKPEVRLMDLKGYQTVQELQAKVEGYKTKNGKLPKGEPVSNGFHYLDFTQLGMKDPQLKSLFNRNQTVSFVLHDSGKVGIDIAPDLAKEIEKQQLASKLEAKQDLREILIQSIPFVPVPSFSYHWEKGQPVPVLEPVQETP